MPRHFLMAAVAGHFLFWPPRIVWKQSRDELNPPLSLPFALSSCSTAVRTELLPWTGWAEVALAARAENASRMRTFEFSGPRTAPGNAHPARLVFDHGPGRQGGRSIKRRTDVLLGCDRGGDQDREVTPFPEPIGGAIATQ